MSELGLKHIDENYNFEDFEKAWVTKMDNIIEENGSWETRRNYARWQLKEIA